MSEIILVEHASAPSVPAAGEVSIWTNDDGVPMVTLSSGEEVQIGGGPWSKIPTHGRHLWVDTGYTGDFSDGTEEAPYSTIQAAVNAVHGHSDYPLLNFGLIELKSTGDFPPAENITVEGKSVIIRSPRGTMAGSLTLDVVVPDGDMMAVVLSGFSYFGDITFSNSGGSGTAVVILEGESILRPMRVGTVSDGLTGAATSSLHMRSASANSVSVSAVLVAREGSRVTGGAVAGAVDVSDSFLDTLSYSTKAIFRHSGVNSITYTGGSPTTGGMVGVIGPLLRGDPLTELVEESWIDNVTFTNCSPLPFRNDLSFFGDGSDGDHTVAGTETLDRAYYFDNLEVPAGTVLQTAGFPVYVRGLLTLEGSIVAPGTDAVAAAEGVGGGEAQTSLSYTALPAGQTGGEGGGPTSTVDAGARPSPITLYAVGGKGGDGGAGSVGAGALGAGQDPADDWVNPPAHAQHLIEGTIPYALSAAGFAFIGGGGGGGGGGDVGGGEDGGGGGGGGGVVVIVARTAYIDAGASIDVSGGDGGAATGGNEGGGGGGGGGAVIFVADGVIGDVSAVSDVTAGAGGAAAGTGGAGSAGEAGSVLVFAPFGGR